MDGWLRARAEVDDERLVSAGTSFGSHWMTPVTPTQPVFRGCSLALPVFEPDARTIFEQTPSTFKVRHMWMAGPYRDEDAFGRPVTGQVRWPLVGQTSVPWQVV